MIIHYIIVIHSLHHRPLFIIVVRCASCIVVRTRAFEFGSHSCLMVVQLQDCDPVKSLDGSSDSNNFYLPCGLIAKSFFNGACEQLAPSLSSILSSISSSRTAVIRNRIRLIPRSSLSSLSLSLSLSADTFALNFPNGSPVPLKKKGIAWSSDLDHKFKNPGSDVNGIRYAIAATITLNYTSLDRFLTHHVWT